MFRQKVYIALAALLCVAIAVAPSSADDDISSTPDPTSSCEDCVGPTLVHLIDKYAEKHSCWFDAKHRNIAKLKIWNLIALIENFKKVISHNNRFVPKECERNVVLPLCDTNNVDKSSRCQMGNLKTTVQCFNDQQICYGKPIVNVPTIIAIKLLRGSFVGWKTIHPDC